MGAGTWVAHFAPDFGSGHDLAVYEFEPHIRLCVDSSEPGACLDSVSFKNKQTLKKIFFFLNLHLQSFCCSPKSAHGGYWTIVVNHLVPRGLAGYCSCVVWFCRKG